MKSFDVALRASNETIYLSVRDAGVGFDTVEGLKGYGIGLTSIRERTRFVNGKVIIHSGPKAGTTIEVEVPLKSELAQATWLSPTVSEE